MISSTMKNREWTATWTNQANSIQSNPITETLCSRECFILLAFLLTWCIRHWHNHTNLSKSMHTPNQLNKSGKTIFSLYARIHFMCINVRFMFYENLNIVLYSPSSLKSIFRIKCSIVCCSITLSVISVAVMNNFNIYTRIHSKNICIHSHTRGIAFRHIVLCMYIVYATAVADVVAFLPSNSMKKRYTKSNWKPLASIMPFAQWTR